MSERKVLNKYYPPDYDPSKVPRIKRKTKQNDVRIMAPFNMRCSTCGNFIANATKFNAKKESVENEDYKSLIIFRFYIKCPRCMATIIFRTNPKDQGYEVERGATENFKSLKIAEKQAREEAEAEEEEEKINPMKHLENRTKASKQQMEASEQIQNLRAIKYKHHTVDLNALIRAKRQEAAQEVETLAITSGESNEKKQAATDCEKVVKKAAVESTALVSSSSYLVSLSKPKPSMKISSSLADLKRKIKVVPKAHQKPPEDNR